MSRYALAPHWLLYLPPTMAPTATGPAGDLLERPATAFAFYRRDGVGQVICQEKHMGSRAVALVCRDGDVARTRFGATQGATGVIHTRTGRSFFPAGLTEQFLHRLRSAITAADLWNELGTDWLLLDSELLPWSVKAEELLRGQYAAVGAAARAALPAQVAVLRAVADRGIDVADLLARTRSRAANADAFTDAYRRYVWPTDGIHGLQIAPFQVLATEGRTWTDHDHPWHLQIADRLVTADPELVRPTRRLVVDATDPDSTAAGEKWWDELTNTGGEGMVVKPLVSCA